MAKPALGVDALSISLKKGPHRETSTAKLAELIDGNWDAGDPSIKELRFWNFLEA